MQEARLKILFAASECTPIAKVGGLGDVIGALPKALATFDVALAKEGCDVRIVLPKYREIDLTKEKVEHISSFSYRGEEIKVYRGTLPGSSVPLYLLENERYFGENGIYFERTAFVGSWKEIARFLFFSELVGEFLPSVQWTPDIVHCNDWHTAAIPYFLKRKGIEAKTLLTIHNLANQGKWDEQQIREFLQITNEQEFPQGNILRQGIISADLLNTVSPSYAKEILTKEYGEGLEDILRPRKKDLFGIVNGIDVERFNPATDPDLKSKYSLKNPELKKENKRYLQQIIGLPVDSSMPLFGFIGRLTSQKGIDLILETIPFLRETNCQLAVLGVGGKEYEDGLETAAKNFPQNISSHIKFDAVLAQQIYAGVDFFLMPSKFEPCGLGQMIAMRYGTIPIVRKTGGLGDTVEHGKTGILFEEYNSQQLLSALKKALELYRNEKKMQNMIACAMNQDFSWQKSAKKYLQLYQKLYALSH
ncbi:MAG: glycogen synthase [Candidatus Wildermuthbacteria bacterium]|nr:glycogen synthase [Candidatus Wildermuthbacteria bacterium]